jgi:hypothetical protein
MIPLRGQVLDATVLREQRDAMAWLRGQVQVGLNDRLPHERIRERILEEPELAKRFSGDSPHLTPLIDRAIDEAAADRMKRGG